MPRNLILLLDGTSNEVKDNLTNVVKLYRCAERSDSQRVFYHPGIGTVPLTTDWSPAAQSAIAGLHGGRLRIRLAAPPVDLGLDGAVVHRPVVERRAAGAHADRGRGRPPATKGLSAIKPLHGLTRGFCNLAILQNYLAESRLEDCMDAPDVQVIQRNTRDLPR